METSVANFGLIPYGHSIVGTPYFEKDNEFGCHQFKDGMSKEGGESPIVLVRRGKCSFVKKVREVEHAGGKLAVIVDEVDNESMDSIIMVDDGTGNGIRIPSIMINKKEGEALIEYYEAGNENDRKKVSLVSTFNIAKPDDRVEYDIWISSSNDRGLDFVKDFQRFNDILGDKVLMTPRYFTWSCINCDANIMGEDCVNNGKYCALDEERLSYSGKEIIMENLRQKCVWKQSAPAWWEYIAKAHQQCYTDFSEDCSKTVHNELGINWDKTQDCIKEANDESNDENKLLSTDAIEWTLRGPHFIPAIVINKITYRGNLDPENVFLAICEGFRDTQPECKTHSKTEKIEKSKVNLTWFLVAIIFIIMVNIIILLLCRKCSTRDMKTSVNSAINEYMSLRKASNTNDQPSDK